MDITIDESRAEPHASARPCSREKGRPHVKICGLRDEATIDLVLSRGAHEIGLVHFAPSPRHLSPARIAALAAHVAGRAIVTVVTVDPGDETLDALLANDSPLQLQLHGRETPERLGAIRKRYGTALMKAVSVGEGGPSVPLDAYRAVADRILLDAKAPKGSMLPGGNGIAFDWRLLAGIDGLARIPFLLSGGLNAGNVGEAIRLARPHGLDVSSGVETAPGEKSAALIHRFFDALDASMSSKAERQAP